MNSNVYGIHLLDKHKENVNKHTLTHTQVFFNRHPLDFFAHQACTTEGVLCVCSTQNTRLIYIYIYTHLFFIPFFAYHTSKAASTTRTTLIHTNTHTHTHTHGKEIEFDSYLYL